MLEKENQELRGELQHEQQKVYQLDQQLRQREMDFARNQQELQEYRQISRVAMEELEKLRKLVETQASALHNEREESKRTQMVSETGCQTIQNTSPKPLKSDAGTDSQYPEAEIAANRAKYLEAIIERNRFVVSLTKLLQAKLNVPEVGEVVQFSVLAQSITSQITKMMGIKEMDKKLEKEKL
jgi:hypothetical protein